MSDTESVSILIPTYNEANNIEGVLKRTIKALDGQGINYEILVIDDASLDGTAKIAEEILDKNGRVIKRVPDTRSLSFSVLDGIKEAKGDIIVVMDGDGSHPPELIPSFIKNLYAGCDLVIGSRYISGGGTKNFPLVRKIVSRFACFLGSIITEVKDNMSGFFCIRKKSMEGVNLVPRGFKIGLEIFAKANFSKYKEIPYIFINREKGESKLNIKTGLEYVYQILCLLSYKISKIKRWYY